MENMKYDEKADCYYCKKWTGVDGAVRKDEKRRPVDTGEPLPYIEVTDAADALSKQTASRGTTAKHQWKTARKYCTFRKK